MIPIDLFEFAYIPDWYGVLDELAALALPEPWKFKAPERETQNTETPILEFYIRRQFRRLALDYTHAPDQTKASRYIFISRNIACIHTGLFTTSYKAIYGCFEKTKRQDVIRQWILKGFADESSPWLKYVEPLPLRMQIPELQYASYFDPEWTMRVNAEHILREPENVERLPESLREAWNLPLLLETAVEFARRRALVEPSIAAQQVYQGSIQYLLPVCMTNMYTPDLAMALSVLEGYYIGHTCLTKEMAYHNARMLARPTAMWLRELVE